MGFLARRSATGTRAARWPSPAAASPAPTGTSRSSTRSCPTPRPGSWWNRCIAPASPATSTGTCSRAATSRRRASRSSAPSASSRRGTSPCACAWGPSASSSATRRFVATPPQIATWITRARTAMCTSRAPCTAMAPSATRRGTWTAVVSRPRRAPDSSAPRTTCSGPASTARSPRTSKTRAALRSTWTRAATGAWPSCSSASRPCGSGAPRARTRTRSSCPSSTCTFTASSWRSPS
mmetsp:Transcript_55585/g.169041  ORF Transcript_55585/g.169041 Transcript_55585/m.169041 type:complete len:237 (+) Transcript_55585:1001-1711(+)